MEIKDVKRKMTPFSGVNSIVGMSETEHSGEDPPETDVLGNNS